MKRYIRANKPAPKGRAIKSSSEHNTSRTDFQKFLGNIKNGVKGFDDTIKVNGTMTDGDGYVQYEVNLLRGRYEFAYIVIVEEANRFTAYYSVLGTDEREFVSGNNLDDISDACVEKCYDIITDCADGIDY
jgi:hypothetical protein